MQPARAMDHLLMDKVQIMNYCVKVALLVTSLIQMIMNSVVIVWKLQSLHHTRDQTFNALLRLIPVSMNQEMRLT